MQNLDTPKVTRDSDKFQLRMPEGMRETMAAQANANGRSMNAEIVDRLLNSFEKDDPAWKLLVLRQNSIIGALAECVEQLLAIPNPDPECQKRISAIAAIFAQINRDT